MNLGPRISPILDSTTTVVESWSCRDGSTGARMVSQTTLLLVFTCCNKFTARRSTLGSPRPIARGCRVARLNHLLVSTSRQPADPSRSPVQSRQHERLVSGVNQSPSVGTTTGSGRMRDWPTFESRLPASCEAGCLMQAFHGPGLILWFVQNLGRGALGHIAKIFIPRLGAAAAFLGDQALLIRHVSKTYLHRDVTRDKARGQVESDTSPALGFRIFLPPTRNVAGEAVPVAHLKLALVPASHCGAMPRAGPSSVRGQPDTGPPLSLRGGVARLINRWVDLVWEETGLTPSEL
uniref:Uncharacterized protein n=1 Tax=Timema tahoe TaxID=61484 RepID=A0A7R9IAJ8_9NEOP|nr:unnamed protein product [Timema tahoe]